MIREFNHHVLVIDRRNNLLDAASVVEVANSSRTATFLVRAEEVHTLNFRVVLIYGGKVSDKVPDLVVRPIMILVTLASIIAMRIAEDFDL